MTDLQFDQLVISDIMKLRAGAKRDLPQFTTGDVGFAIRDHLESNEIFRNIEHDDEWTVDASDEIASVDVSDAHTPIVELSNGQRFKLTITAL